MNEGCGGRAEAGVSCRYEAFISYSHAEGDVRVAREVQRFIEGFSIPRPLRERAGRSRLGMVFRDEDELAAGASLTAKLEGALEQSAWLIVVCSPDAAASPWVQREIELFGRIHGTDRILAVLSAGEPADSFPEALSSGAGDPEVSTEPLAADLREAVSGADRKLELLRLVAPMIHCAYDDLVRRRRARMVRRAALAALAIAVLAASVGGVVMEQRRATRGVEAAARAESSRQAALDALAAGDRIESLRLALEGAAPDGDPVQRARARNVLARALGVYGGPTGSKLLYSIDGVADASTFTASVDPMWFAVLDSEERITAYDPTNGSVAARFESSEVGASGNARFDCAVAVSGRLLATLKGGGLVCYDVVSGKKAWELLDVGRVCLIEPLGGVLAAALVEDDSGSAGLLSVDMGSGAVGNKVALDGVDAGHATMASCGDGRVALASGDELVFVESGFAQVRRAPLSAPDITGMLIHEGAVYTASSADGAGRFCSYSWGDGAERWSIDRSWSGYDLEFSAVPFMSSAQLGEVEFSSVLGADVLSASAGNAILLIDVLTGEVMAELESDAPIVQFDHVSSGDRGVMRATDITGARLVSSVRPGAGKLAGLEGYGFGDYVWHAEELNGGDVRYAIGCSAKRTDTILVYRDDLGLPAEPGVSAAAMASRINGISSSDDRRRIAVYTQEEEIWILDGKTFEPVTTIDLVDAGIELSDRVSTRMVLTGGGESLVLCDPGVGAVPPRAWRLSAETGELLGAWTWPHHVEGSSYEGCVFSSGRGGYVSLHMPNMGYLGLMDLERLEVAQEFTVDEVAFTDIIRAGDSRLIMVHDDGFAVLADAGTYEHVESALDEMAFESGSGEAQIAVSPDGRRIATVSPEHGLALVDARTGELAWEAPLESDGREFVAFSPDGSCLAVQDARGAFSLHSADDGALIGSSDEVEGLVVGVDFLQGASGLAVYSSDAVSRVCQLLELHGGDLEQAVRIRGAWFLSTDADRALILGRRLYSQPVYELDELRRMAQAEVDAFGAR